jgi:hypothetical protein
MDVLGIEKQAIVVEEIELTSSYKTKSLSIISI